MDHTSLLSVTQNLSLRCEQDSVETETEIERDKENNGERYGSSLTSNQCHHDTTAKETRVHCAIKHSLITNFF